MSVKKAPVGVFDSGMGGLTVLNALRKKLPGEDFVYFGDTAHLPYGSKSASAVKKYAMRAGKFFKNKKIKLMVVACNTASVYALDELKKNMPFEVLGVILPGIRAALNNNKNNSIGVIGTYGTVKSGIYRSLILESSPSSRVVSRACPLFVPLVEEGWRDHEITKQVARLYLEDFLPGLDSLILGCTHYPLLKDIIRSVAGSSLNIVDSAYEAAAEASRLLNNSGIASEEKSGSVEYYVSDAPELFRESASVFLEEAVEVKEVGLLETD